MDTEVDRIKEVTNRFRAGADGFWIGIKALLAKEGIDPASVIVADTFPEDHSQIYVAIVTNTRQVFEFYYDWLHKEQSEGQINEWKDLTKTPDAAYRKDSVRLALELIGKM
jgi:hypothetical protein